MKRMHTSGEGQAALPKSYRQHPSSMKMSFTRHARKGRMSEGITDPISVGMDPISVGMDAVSLILDPVSVILDPVSVILDPVSVMMDPVSVMLDPISVGILDAEL